LKLPIIGILSGVALATLGISSAAQAAILLPSLTPGSQYRLVFVTSGTRDATSTNIADYNQFVKSAAQASTNLNTALTTAGLTPSAINWTAIGSTATVNARVNTATQTTDPSVPIYRVDGAQFETGNVNLWDSTKVRLSSLNITELGNSTTNFFVYTGTNSNGTTSSNELGDSIRTSFGRSNNSNNKWVNDGSFPNSNNFSFYGISSIVTVPTATATPEPSSLLSFITLGGLILGGAVRGVRK